MLGLEQPGLHPKAHVVVVLNRLAVQKLDYGGEAALHPDGNDADQDWPDDNDNGAHGLPISPEEAADLFRDLLDDHNISPFTPCEKLISDDSATSILLDDRYTVLSTTRSRREVWAIWVRDKAGQLKVERAKNEKQDPRIPYLAFLQEKATPKLYWPEFKRKFKKDAVMSDRKLADKDRERLYREHVNRLKLPESARKGDLITLLKGVPLRDLNRGTNIDSLPQQVLSQVPFISLRVSTRDQLIVQHIAALPPAPRADDGSDEHRAEQERKRADRRRREEALAERQRKVDQEGRLQEKAERFARRELREGEAELEGAMAVPGKGARGMVGK
ncbi:hypothetical protein LTR02_016679 [Friedmanniomyces endolithicus]|nr:hypothetical protein LTR02_016679 [Friedmanniomyces endolithicus]